LKDSISGWGKNCELLASRCQLHVVFRWGQRYNLSHCSYSSYLRRNLNRVRDYFIFLTSSRVTVEWRDKLVSCSQSRVCRYFLREFGEGKVPFSPPSPDSPVFFFPEFSSSSSTPSSLTVAVHVRHESLYISLSSFPTYLKFICSDPARMVTLAKHQRGMMKSCVVWTTRTTAGTVSLLPGGGRWKIRGGGT